MRRKAPRRTRERILEAALRLFNGLGEANVTSTAIADELGMSPGNLHYHFASKDDIVNALFTQYEGEIDPLLAVPDSASAHPEDLWLFLHLLFETIWRYRCFYRDLNPLLMRNRLVETHFQRILARQHAATAALLDGLAAAGDLAAPAQERALMATHITLTTNFWLSYEHARAPRNAPDIGRGAYHALSLVAPWLQGDARAWWSRLSTAYIAQ